MMQHLMGLWWGQGTMHLSSPWRGSTSLCSLAQGWAYNTDSSCSGNHQIWNTDLTLKRTLVEDPVIFFSLTNQQFLGAGTYNSWTLIKYTTEVAISHLYSWQGGIHLDLLSCRILTPFAIVFWDGHHNAHFSLFHRVKPGLNHMCISGVQLTLKNFC